MNKYFRSLKSKYQQIPYEEGQLAIFQCHWGQMKLLYSEIEFLTIVSKYISLDGYTVVYVGAAPCMHLTIVLKMFPECKWILVDPSKFAVKENDKVKIINDYFTYDTVKLIKNIVKSSKILFISDMRREVNEKEIWIDMINQEKWGILLDSEFIMLKLRFPFTNIESGTLNFEYNIDDINDKIVITNNITDKKNKLYLMGKIFLQIFPRARSTETRLITSKIRYFNDRLKHRQPDINNDKYLLKYYDSIKYESQLNYFNLIDRTKKYKYKNSELMKKYILGFDDSYDCVGMYYILFKYMKQKHLENENIFKMLFDIYKFMNSLSRKNIITCQVQTNVNRLKRDNKIVMKLMDDKKDFYEKQLKILDQSIESKENQIKIYNNAVVISDHKVIVRITNSKMNIYPKLLII